MYEQSSNDFATGYAVGRDSTNCGGGMFGNDQWSWWIIILLIFGWGGNGYGFGGFGGGYGAGAFATQADLAAGFNNSAVLNNLNDLKLGQAGLQQTLCQGFNGVNTAMLQGFNGVDNAVCTLGYNTQAGFNGLSRQIAECCCDTRAAIADVKYANERNTCDIIRAGQDNTRAILDFLTTDKISTLTAENQALKFQASQTAQNAYIGATVDAGIAEIIRRTGHDCPQAAYIVQPPQPVTFPTNCCGTVNVAGYGYNGCGCGTSIQ